MITKKALNFSAFGDILGNIRGLYKNTNRLRNSVSPIASEILGNGTGKNTLSAFENAARVWQAQLDARHAVDLMNQNSRYYSKMQKKLTEFDKKISEANALGNSNAVKDLTAQKALIEQQNADLVRRLHSGEFSTPEIQKRLQELDKEVNGNTFRNFLNNHVAPGYFEPRRKSEYERLLSEINSGQHMDYFGRLNPVKNIGENIGSAIAKDIEGIDAMSLGRRHATQSVTDLFNNNDLKGVNKFIDYLGFGGKRRADKYKELRQRLLEDAQMVSDTNAGAGLVSKAIPEVPLAGKMTGLVGTTSGKANEYLQGQLKALEELEKAGIVPDSRIELLKSLGAWGGLAGGLYGAKRGIDALFDNADEQYTDYFENNPYTNGTDTAYTGMYPESLPYTQLPNTAAVPAAY